MSGRTRAEESRAMEHRSLDGREMESRAAEMRRVEHEENPFLNATQSILPAFTPNPDYDYLWMRAEVQGQTDASNVSAHTNSLFGYSYVSPSEQPHLAMYTVQNPVAGQDGTVIRIMDCVAMKIPKKTRRMYLEAKEIEADQLASKLRSKTASHFDRRHGFEYEDHAVDETRRLPVRD